MIMRETPRDLPHPIIEKRSPRLTARVTGLLYLLTILTGIFAQGFVRDGLPDHDDGSVLFFA